MTRLAGPTPLQLLRAGVAVAVCAVTLAAVPFAPPLGPRVALAQTVTDLDLDSANGFAEGIWGNDETVWVANNGTAEADNKIFAYSRSDAANATPARTSTRWTPRTTTTRGASGPTARPCSWWTTTTRRSTPTRCWTTRPQPTQTSSPPATPARTSTWTTAHNVPIGIWGNASTIWVSNDGNGAQNKIYAYTASDGTRDSGNDFTTLNAAGNTDVRDIWSDGDTMWVVDSTDDARSTPTRCRTGRVIRLGTSRWTPTTETRSAPGPTATPCS